MNVQMDRQTNKWTNDEGAFNIDNIQISRKNVSVRWIHKMFPTNSHLFSKIPKAKTEKILELVKN